MDTLRIFTGTANRPLSDRICKYLCIEPSDAKVSRFNDGEIRVRINENVRGCDVFVVQPTQAPAENLLELLIVVDALRRASPRRVTAVIPYFGYARQDRKDRPRAPISAKLVANLVTVAGADRVLTMDLHSSQIQGFFDIPFDHLFAAPVLLGYFRDRAMKDTVVVGPDIGSAKMARAYAKRLGADLALVDKRRTDDGETAVMHLIGEVEGKNAIIFDDMISTGGTLARAAAALKENGARTIYAGCTHAILTEKSFENLRNSDIQELVVTDTIPQEHVPEGIGIRVLSIDELLGEAIRRIHEERSLSSLFI
ncbi:MAG: ribose-phosphate pyrophosphokinase [Candidatus Eisenbacteria bacterium]|uniref:Ribose-phosphate pyrophosphokinase n=1 Tax=Eiseniibacteriota bacterium TaxID=2212470 RepID=A0A948RS81_UNCEI|nr:ribose-phosphate pyrophosphokinase [Candidatus Eisenbacteria bacterium]MBU1950655.1 ribose-phosphate pyrophosphokinase [Candidatus Eisenbacteria bacterium]MBU2689646.1 ribose-phosphate pyrophosphokinase [Candidatus Eisenbacteria bacterium]